MAATSGSAQGAVTTGGGYVAISPSRLLDTRNGTGAAAAAVGAHATVTLQVTGKVTIPVDAVAVALNVTVVSPPAAGFVTVWGSGTRPATSNLNYLAGQTVANAVLTPLTSTGTVELYNSSAGTAQLLADVAGYYTAGTPTSPGALTALTPIRLLDTRHAVGAPAQAVGPHTTVTLKVTGTAAIPTGAAAAVLNVTAVSASTSSFVTVWGGGERPNASNLNFVAGRTVANLVITPIAADGTVHLYNAVGTVQLIADVSGYFLGGSPSAEGTLTSLTPARVLDSRNGVGGPATAFGPSETRYLKITGAGGVPASGVAAVVLNVTAIGATSAGYLSAYPTGTPKPTTSNVNYARAATVPNLVIAPVGSDGTIAIYNGSTGSTNVFIDVSGYVLGSPQARRAWLPAQAAPPTDVNPSSVYLDDVTCPSVSSCVALGQYTDDNGTAGLLEVLSGRTWKVVASPVPSGASLPVFYQGLACPAVGWCAALGNTGNNRSVVTILASDQPTSTILPVPAGGTGASFFGGIACPAAGSCIAVGSYQDSTTSHPIVDTLANGKWTTRLLAGPAGVNSEGVSLDDVACPSISSCVAIGDYTDTSAHPQALVAILSAGAWTVRTTPVPADAASVAAPEQYALACAAVGSCQIVGRYSTAAGAAVPLIVAVSGPSVSARRGPLPSTTTGSIAYLRDVSCSTATSCVAVGTYDTDSDTAGGNAVIDTLNAGTWTAQLAPTTSPAAAQSQLQSVTCPAPGLCTAVGQYGDDATTQSPLITTLVNGRWTATTPSLASGADAATAYSFLSAVACAPSNTTCAAVGSYPLDAFTSAGLIETWLP